MASLMEMFSCYMCGDSAEDPESFRERHGSIDFHENANESAWEDGSHKRNGPEDCHIYDAIGLDEPPSANPQEDNPPSTPPKAVLGMEPEDVSNTTRTPQHTPLKPKPRSERKQMSNVISEIQSTHVRKRSSTLAQNLDELKRLFNNVVDATFSNLDSLVAFQSEVAEAAEALGLSSDSDWRDQLDTTSLVNDQEPKSHYLVIAHQAFQRFQNITTMASWVRTLRVITAECTLGETLDKNNQKSRADILDQLMDVARNAASYRDAMKPTNSEMASASEAMRALNLPMDEFEQKRSDLLLEMERLGEDAYTIVTKEVGGFRKDKTFVQRRRGPLVLANIQKAMDLVDFLLSLQMDSFVQDCLLPSCRDDLTRLGTEVQVRGMGPTVDGIEYTVRCNFPRKHRGACGLELVASSAEEIFVTGFTVLPSGRKMPPEENGVLLMSRLIGINNQDVAYLEGRIQVGTAIQAPTVDEYIRYEVLKSTTIVFRLEKFADLHGSEGAEAGLTSWFF